MPLQIFVFVWFRIDVYRSLLRIKSVRLHVEVCRPVARWRSGSTVGICSISLQVVALFDALYFSLGFRVEKLDFHALSKPFYTWR